MRRPVEPKLHEAIGVVHESRRDGLSIMAGLLQSIEHEAGMCRPTDAPADYPTGVGVDHEGHVVEARLTRHVDEVRDPQHVRPELTVDGSNGQGVALSLTGAQQLAGE